MRRGGFSIDSGIFLWYSEDLFPNFQLMGGYGYEPEGFSICAVSFVAFASGAFGVHCCSECGIDIDFEGAVASV